MALQRIELAGAAFYTQGAHIAEWTPTGERPVLFMSSKNSFEPGKPIRGGVPIIFPWFGSRPEGAHGYARTRVWTIQEQGERDVTLTLDPDDFRLQFRATFGDTLSMEFSVHNVSKDPQSVEMALHTYLSIGDIDQVWITGLDGTEYIDKTDAFRRRQQSGDLRVTGPTDRVFVNTASVCTLHDPAWKRSIVVEKAGSNSTVVWNPYAPLADLDNWRGMICIETANAADNAVTIQPGETHKMTAGISIAHGS